MSQPLAWQFYEFDDEGEDRVFYAPRRSQPINVVAVDAPSGLPIGEPVPGAPARRWGRGSAAVPNPC